MAGMAQWMRFIVPPERRVFARAAGMASGDAHGVNAALDVDLHEPAARRRRAEGPDDGRGMKPALVEMRGCSRADPYHDLDADDHRCQRLHSRYRPAFGKRQHGRHDHRAGMGV
jgi:hypothetical protein